jgi:DNA-binding FadR family transcriptional regulator
MTHEPLAPAALSSALHDGPVAEGPVKLSDVAYAKIFGRISSGEYPVGGRLPTENALAILLSVSRPVVREALARLRDDGVVVSRRGSGTYVRKAPQPDQARAAPLMNIADMRRCLEFRISLEGETAYRAALRSQGREALTAAVARLEAGMAEDRIDIADDYAFHAAVADCTGNRFFQAVMADLKPSITTGMEITRSFGLLGTREALEALHREHLAVYDAIMANDAEGARTAMRLHLENAMKRAFEGVGD